MSEHSIAAGRGQSYGATGLNLIMGGSYDRVRPLTDGRVNIPGIDINVDLMPTSHDVFHELCQGDQYDGGELSLSFYSTFVSKYGDQSPVVGLPVFISRMYRHGNIVINRASGIKTPKDLEGKRVALPEYGMTMAVWIRGMLKHDHGVDTDSFKWISGRRPVALRPDELCYPTHISVQQGAVQKLLIEDLAAGKFDAVIGPVPRGLPDNVERLFPDYARAERDYHQRTSIFPIMHVLVLRRAAFERHRDRINDIYRAFVQAKEVAIDELWNTSVFRVSMPWLLTAVAEQTAAYGGDLWSYGLQKNRATIDAYLTYAWEQGLIWRQLKAEELFTAVDHH